MKKILKQLDFSGATVSWNVCDETRTKTMFGAFFSLVSIGTLIYITWVSGKDMIYKSKPTVNTEDISYSSRPALALNDQTFSVAITCQDYRQKNFLDPNYFNIEAFSTRLINSNSTYIEQKLELIQCNYSNFPTFSKEYLDSSGMLNYLCIKDQNVYISGYLDEPSLDYLSLVISPCRNSSEHNSCVSIDEIKSVFENNPTPLTFSIYFKTSIINTLDYETPFKSYMLNIWENIQFGTHKMTTVFIRQDVVSTDSNILEKSENDEFAIMYDSLIKDSYPAKSADPLVEIMILVANHNLNYHRKYLKLLDLCATIGGLTKFLLTASQILVYSLSITITNKRILNKLFHYNYNFENLNSLSLSTKLNNYFQDGRSTLSRCIKKDNLEKKTLEFKPYEYLCIVPCFRFCASKNSKLKWRLYENSKTIISSKLDISNALPIFQEFVKLKEMLMNKDQIDVFECQAKSKMNAYGMLVAPKLADKNPNKIPLSSDCTKLLESYFHFKLNICEDKRSTDHLHG